VHIPCGAERHPLTWRAGALHLEAHPDPEAEAVLAALGGTPPACLGFAALWRDAAADGGFIADWAGTERVDRLLQWRRETALGRLAREGVQDFLHGVPRARAERMGEALVRLSLPLQDRAALAVARRVVAGGPGAEPQLAGWLAEAVRLRARSAFVRSLSAYAEWCRPAALVPLQVQVAWAGGAPEVEGRLAGRASAVVLRLPLSWLAEVWGRGLPLVDGHFAVAVTSGPGGDEVGATATVVRWEADGPGLRARLAAVAVSPPADPAGG
jgi:hypothetical protein